jgi:hypothetical protein
MKVSELIEKLSAYPPDMLVRIAYQSALYAPEFLAVKRGRGKDYLVYPDGGSLAFGEKEPLTYVDSGCSEDEMEDVLCLGGEGT